MDYVPDDARPMTPLPTVVGPKWDCFAGHLEISLTWVTMPRCPWVSPNLMRLRRRVRITVAANPPAIVKKFLARRPHSVVRIMSSCGGIWVDHLGDNL